ncbi:cytochrome c-type biogenesis protein [Anaerobacillus isosaccharinicus]|uniref:Cytochrome c-type biogenesis protein n=1 Tax=Anaerobacillus isosaccharinicus TaxID=1532552 RepID=A0A1S2MI26_9BACI|nr:cytochrome c-type biogenesis protein [Anaerobacillus isosaccharinicus]MBA5584169.1 cytochrome c-type biogenesis protein CcmH [Anaerobacillus isosaccharinicus]QOY37424.1 cytochrome c-type biogenesis protein CcmH [Anaerobacillus isosaccharinicus]
MKKVIAALTLLLLISVIPAYAGDQYDFKSAEFKEVASQFMCMCGCGQDHFECNMQGCGLNDSFKQEMKEMMDDGLTKDEIKDYYIGMYGEEILTAPEKKGFSLTAWILPFAVLGVAGVGIVFVIRKWVAGYKEEPILFEELTEEQELEDEIVKSMIDEERKKYF